MTTDTQTIDVTDHRNEQLDEITGFCETARDIAHHLDCLSMSDLMRKDLLDGFCTLLSRMAARRTTRSATLAKKLDDTPDVGDEISGVQRDDLEDQLAAAGAEIKAIELALEGASTAYEELCGERWCPASATSRTYHGSLALATEIALGNIQPSTPEHRAYRVLVTGDANTANPGLVTEYLDKIAARHGSHKLWLYTGDAPRGVDGSVLEWARTHRVTVRQFGLKHDRHGKRAGFIRNKTMIANAEPHAVLIFGGGGVQADLVDVALNNGVKHVLTPVAPLGWTADENLRPHRSRAPSSPPAA